MKIKQKDKQVFFSIDKLSREMAQYIVSNNKEKLIEEIEEDILKSEKTKKVKEKHSNNQFIFFSSDSSERQSQKDNNSQNSKVNQDKNIDKNKENKEAKNNNVSPTKNLIFSRDKNNSENMATKKTKKVCFALDKKKNFEEINNIIGSKENINNNTNKNDDTNNNNNNNKNNNAINIYNNKENKNINYDENEFLDGNKIIIKNDKEDLEITLSPIYGYKGDEDEINYYKIKSYIDKNKKKLQKKLYKADKTYNTNLTASFGDNKAINKNKILLKDKEKEGKDNLLINKSYTDRNKAINSLQKIGCNLELKKKKYNATKERNTLIDKKDTFNQKNRNAKYIDNISDYQDNKHSKESSSGNNYNSKLNSSTDLVNSSYDFSITTSSNNVNNNPAINYCKNGKNQKYISFLEKQLKRQRLTELKVNKMKRDKELKEFQNYYSSPKINSLSLQIVNNKGNYIPLFKRAIEIENEKKMKRMIRQKMQNKNFIINISNYTKRTSKQINDFFYAQMSWKDRVEKKNKYLQKSLIEQKNEQNSEILNYEMKINPKSELIILKKRRQNNLSLIDISQSNSTIISDSANRLYKDYEIRQKKLKKLKRELTPSFMPSINKSPKIHFYKKIRKNYKMNINEKIKEVNIKEYDSSYKYKYQSYNQGINSRNATGPIKSQKSRNFKGISKNLVSSRFFNKKENNLKSTAVDSRNTKSAQKVSSDINNTKLEKINEYNTSNEYSHQNINSSNKIIEIKANKSNLNTSLNNLNINTKNEENKKSKYNTKNSENKKANSKKSQSKESKSKSAESKSEESKSEKSKTESSQSDTESEKESKNTKKENSKSKVKDKFIINEENKESKDKGDNKDKQSKEKENNEKEKDSVKKNNSLARAFTMKEKDKKEKNNNLKTKRRFNSMSNIPPKIPQQMSNNRPIKKSINEIKLNKNNFMKNIIKAPFNRHKSVITKKSSELLLTNKYKDKLTPQLGNSIQNQNDTIELNNIDKGNYNLLNDFFTNKSISKAKNNNNTRRNSLFNDEIQIMPQKDDFFDENFKSNISLEKKSEKKVIIKYKFDCTGDYENEEEEENEEKDEGGNKSISWIKKLKEISKNEEIKEDREKDEMNKRKKGASTTRSQTKRKSNDKEKDFINRNSEGDDKLYMLNLRNSSATGKLNPYTVTAKEQIFYKFFLKK